MVKDSRLKKLWLDAKVKPKLLWNATLISNYWISWFLEHSIRKLKLKQSSENLNAEERIRALEEERDQLIEENSRKFEASRALQVNASRPKVLSRALVPMYKVTDPP